MASLMELRDEYDAFLRQEVSSNAQKREREYSNRLDSQVETNWLFEYHQSCTHSTPVYFCFFDFYSVSDTWNELARPWTTTMNEVGD